MPADSAAEITRLLRAWAQGEEAALDELAPMVYRELRERAGKYMGRERRAVTLQADGVSE